MKMNAITLFDKRNKNQYNYTVVMDNDVYMGCPSAF